MIDDVEAGRILTAMVQIGRTFRVSGQRTGSRSRTGTKYGILKYLSHCDARLTDLAHRFMVSIPVTSRAIDGLEEAGYVERRSDPADARASLISITELGREQLRASDRRTVSQFAQALDDWSSEDVDQAVALLEKLNLHLEHVIGIRDADAETTSAPSPEPITTGSESNG